MSTVVPMNMETKARPPSSSNYAKYLAGFFFVTTVGLAIGVVLSSDDDNDSVSADIADISTRGYYAQSVDRHQFAVESDFTSANVGELETIFQAALTKPNQAMWHNGEVLADESYRDLEF